MDDVFSAEMQALSARALQRLRAADCAIADEAALARLDRTKPVSVLFRRGEWAQYAIIRPGR